MAIFRRKPSTARTANRSSVGGCSCCRTWSKNLYRQFKLDEAWDGPHNKGLLAQMPKVFADPAVESKDPMTVYQAFVGPGAFLEDKKGLPISEFTDGTSNTIMIVEAA